MQSMRSTSILIPATILLYVLSVLPLSALLNWEQVDLKAVVQQVQKLSESSCSEDVDFQKSFKAALGMLMTNAGLHSVIVKIPMDISHEEANIIIISHKPAQIIAGDYAVPLYFQDDQQLFSYQLEYQNIYIPPPIPPPVASTHV